MIPIVYGMPSGEMFAAAERGEVCLGGCAIEPGAPTHACKRCGRKKGRLLFDATCAIKLLLRVVRR